MAPFRLASVASNVVVAGLLVCSLSPLAVASGGYGGGKPPTPKTNPQNELYELGQQIFDGKITLPKEVDQAMMAKQKPQLEDLSNKLMKAGRANTIGSLAGRLSERQFNGLVQYLSTRFKLN